MLFIKINEIFWYRDVTDIWVLANLWFKTHKRYQVLYVLHCFKYFLIYIFGQNVSKKPDKNILNYMKSSSKFLKIFSIVYFGTKCPQKNQVRKIGNSFMSSCKIFCAKMFQYFYIVYY